MKNNSISMSRLAKICGVSQGTVDRALHNRDGISAKTRDKILKAAREYGYRPNQQADKKETKLLGVIMFDLYNEYNAELIEVIEAAFKKQGYYTLVMFSHKDKDEELRCIESMYNAGVEGIIICPVNSGTEFGEYLKSWKIPIVTIGNRVNGIKYVGCDDKSAMKDMTELIIGKGYKKLIYFSPALMKSDTNIYAQSRRFDGFKAAAYENNIPYRVEVSAQKVIDHTDAETAVVASTDYYAIKLILSGLGKEIFLCGFDNIKSVKKYNVPIMTVACNKEQMAERIAEYISGEADDGDVFVPYEII